MQTRREFLRRTAVAGAGLAAYGLLRPGTARAFYQTPAGTTKLFATEFRGPVQIPTVVTERGTSALQKINLSIREFTDSIHPQSGWKTKLWGYHPEGGTVATPAHLGGILIAHQGQPVQLTVTNALPSQHILPVDTSIMGAEGAQNRTAVHLHGGFVSWESDGGPYAWFAPDATCGSSFVNGGVDGSGVLLPLVPSPPGTNPGTQAVYYWPMQQSARMMWYHDHAIGLTRLNAYAGIASAVLLRDSYEAGLVQSRGLPKYIEDGGLELPIVVQDKTFVGGDGGAADGWSGIPGVPKDPGSLWYAHAYDTARYGKLGPQPLGPPPAISCVPEFFGDTMLANGTVYPEASVEPRRYRLRILNACNARFLNLQMYVDDGSPAGITLDNKGNPLNVGALNPAAANSQGKPTSNFLVLGTEGGFLPKPAHVASAVPFNGTPAGGSLLLAPAERADVLFDFSLYAGKNVVLYTDCPAPFPMGDPLNDFFPGLANKNPVNAATAATPAYGPNTRIIMRFAVKPAATVADDAPLSLTKASDLSAGNDPLLARPGAMQLPASVQKTRVLTLNEAFDEHGRLIQFLGTDVPMAGATGYGRPYDSGVTETPSAGAMEVWQIVNLTADTHPIHFHLVNVQIISRQAFTKFSGNPGVANLSGAPMPPAPYEQGWKETVRMNPGEVTTVAMKFQLPAGLPYTVQDSPRTGGKEYVWHCHILEHEEHDMMRPLVVT